MNTRCNVCSESLGEPIFQSHSQQSLTSMCELREGKTLVSFCDACGHTQTADLPDAAEFYEANYNILIDSEEQDQLYKIENGRKIFRLDHQAETVLSKVTLETGAHVLDYGAAKGSSLKTLCKHRPDIRPHFFDVSQKYVPFWESFVGEEQWACYQPRDDWAGKFDLVTSFFVAEHVAELTGMFETVASLLKPGGTFFFTIPNTFANIADFIVVDHVNHFSPISLMTLLERHGFQDVSVDSEAHESAFVVTANLPEHADNERQAGKTATTCQQEIASLRRQVLAMSTYWQRVTGEISEWESATSSSDNVAIYGSGFYGSYIASCLGNTERVTCFLDANPHQQGNSLFGKPIMAPQELPAHIRHVYVGLNPRIARTAMANVEGWNHRELNLFFLPEIDAEGGKVAA